MSHVGNAGVLRWWFWAGGLSPALGRVRTVGCSCTCRDGGSTWAADDKSSVLHCSSEHTRSLPARVRLEGVVANLPDCYSARLVHALL